MNSYLKALTITGMMLMSLTGVNLDAAHADDDTATILPVKKPFGVKVGGLLPSSGKVNIFGDGMKIDTLYRIGLSYDVIKTSATAPVVFGVYGEYLSGGKTATLNVGSTKSDSETYAIGASARFLLTSADDTKGQPYVEAGVGYYSDKIKLTGGASGSKTEGGLGAKLSVGYQLSSGVFGEVGYTLIKKFSTNGVSFDPSGVQGAIGVRF